MAKKTSIKVRLVPESKPDSPFFYYVKKPSAGEKAKVKLKVKKYNPATRKHKIFIEKKLPPHSKYLLFKHLIRNRQRLSTFSSPSRNHFSTISSRHALPKAMLVFSFCI